MVVHGGGQSNHSWIPASSWSPGIESGEGLYQDSSQADLGLG